MAKLTAARGASPSFEIKKRSAASKEKMATRPRANGVPCRRRCAATGPFVRFCISEIDLSLFWLSNISRDALSCIEYTLQHQLKGQETGMNRAMRFSSAAMGMVFLAGLAWTISLPMIVRNKNDYPVPISTHHRD
jgi:hypothetical protein